MNDFDKAMLDPTSVFRSPDEVYRRHDFSSAQKIDILCRWAYDARQLEVAEDEGMPSSQPDILDEILQALHKLGAQLDSKRATSKQSNRSLARKQNTC